MTLWGRFAQPNLKGSSLSNPELQICTAEFERELPFKSKLPFYPKLEPFGTPRGAPKSEKSPKVPTKAALFTPPEKHLEISPFLDPPEPSEWSSRLHETSIDACWPCPPNVVKRTSQNLPFGHLWPPKGPQVQKNGPLEHT